MAPTTAAGNGAELLCWSTKATWMKGSTVSSTACGVQPGLRSLEELQAAALEELQEAALEQLQAAAWHCLGMLEKRRKGLCPGRREPLAALLGPPTEERKKWKGRVKGGDKEAAGPMAMAWR
jgi:hypothetical protein